MCKACENDFPVGGGARSEQIEQPSEPLLQRKKVFSDSKTMSILDFK